MAAQIIDGIQLAKAHRDRVAERVRSLTAHAGPGAVDRLRAQANQAGADALGQATPVALVLAATDPANPYGAALAWPARGASGHQPGRKAGAIVVLVAGRLILYVERGGRTLLSFTEEADDLALAAVALAEAAHAGHLGRMTVTKVDGEVAAYGKHILIRLDNGWTLHTHLRMDGRWAFARPSAARVRFSPQARVVLGTTEWLAVGLSLGMLDLVRTRDEGSLIGHLGPDILADDFDLDVVITRLADCSAPIGAALLDQTNLAGIGTFWAAEGLFVRRLDPWRPAVEVGPDPLRALIGWTRRTMLAALTTPVQTSTGATASGRTSYVHGRLRQGCRRCGTPIAVAQIGPPTKERPMFHCPACQGVTRD